MSRFTFALQRLLNLRQGTEQQRAIEMQRAAAREMVRREKSTESSAAVERVSAQTGEISIAPAGVWHAYALSAEAARARAEHDAALLGEARAEREHQEQQFTEARQSRRALERLRDRQSAEWTRRESQAEQADTDEVARRMTRSEEQG